MDPIEEALAATSDAPPAIEHTTAEDIQKLLENTPYSSTNIQLLSGGFTNYTFSATLDFPFAAPLAPPEEQNVQSVIIKHAEPFSRTARHVTLSMQRSVSL